jgi:glutathione S-transferase
MREQPKITLYGPAVAPFTEKVRRALVLKGLEFELREPSGPEDYRRWSPETGLLPVAAIGEERVHDSTAILWRLEALFPEPPLLSADPVVAEQQRQLEDWADESFMWYFRRWLAGQQPSARTEVEAAYEVRARRRLPSPLRHAFAWLRAGGTWERPETALLRGLSDRMGDLVNFLGARPFFYASRVSMADLAVYGMLFVMRLDAIPGSARVLAERPTLLDFMRRVEEATGG